MSRTDHHTPNYNNAVGAFGLAYHLEMVKDHERVGQITAALSLQLKPDSIMCELGCGSGIFSIHAARICNKVYAVDKDPEVLALARENAKRAGVLDKIHFVEADALTVGLPEKCDVVLCEMLSTWMVNEPQVPVIRNARSKLLKTGGKLIPERIINLVDLGNYSYDINGVYVKASVAQFTGTTAPRVMTETRVFNSIDLRKDIDMKIASSCHLKSLTDGVINCGRLSSIVCLGEGTNFYSTDTLMPITIVPLEEQLTVELNQNLIFKASYLHRSNLDDSKFSLELEKA